MSNIHVPKFLLIITALLAVVLVALFTFMAGRNTTQTTNTLVQTTVNEPEELVTNNNTTVANTTISETATTADVTWLDEPEQLSDLDLLTYQPDHVAYYKVATLADGGSLISIHSSGLDYLLLQQRSGGYRLLTNHSFFATLDESEVATLDSVAQDSITTYAELIDPDVLTVNDVKLQPSGHFFNCIFCGTLSGEAWVDPVTFSKKIQSGEKITGVSVQSFGDSIYGQVYQLIYFGETMGGPVAYTEYVVVLADHTIQEYQDLTQLMADDNTLIVNWFSDYADFAARTYLAGVGSGGCGSIVYNSYVAEIDPRDIEQVGETTTGASVYAITDAQNQVFEIVLSQYSIGRQDNETASLESLVENRPVLLVENINGNYFIFTDTSYSPAAECGKPVVYLYPPSTTTISVQVGADVIESEPAYGNGWTVTAEPNGRLTQADGLVYSNLFWEGKGYGVYPKIQTGKVVARQAVAETIRTDLAVIGLNETEITDFLDFWLPKLPNTPYVRLTWLNTKEMNQLAPLNITPRPDTVIRTFLDFFGQQTPDTTLVPQVLTSTPRDGFTVIEWGGLLLGQ